MGAFSRTGLGQRTRLERRPTAVGGGLEQLTRTSVRVADFRQGVFT